MSRRRKHLHSLKGLARIGGLGALAWATALGTSPDATARKTAQGAPALDDDAGSSRGPRVVTGRLSPPRAGRADEVAREFLADHPRFLRGVAAQSLRVERAHPLDDGGTLVKLAQVHAGLPVLGPSVAVRTDGAGQVRWSSADAVPVPADLSVSPALSPQHAVDVLTGGPLSRYAGVAFDPAASSHLVVWALRGEPRLAWRVVFPGNVERVEVMEAFVDAQDGSFLGSRNLARTAQGKVYLSNPVSTPTLTTVTLGGVTDPAAGLASADVVTRNCVDTMQCLDLGQVNLRMCDQSKSTAVADANGDFLIDPPASDLDPEDAFAEVQMFHHVTQAYAFFRGLGLTNLKSRPLAAIVNMRIARSPVCQPVGPSTVPLGAFDNAAFMPGGAFLSSEDQIVFGQGSACDFAWDGDVVAHEFGHAVMGTVSPDVQVALVDDYGIDSTPGGMVEGFPDYFSSALAGDSEVGEYSGKALVQDPLPSGAIRSLENTKRCPDDLWGESHQDAEPWSGALWQIRKAVTDKAGFDKAVYTAMTALGGTDNFESASAKIIAEVETRLGADAKAVAVAKFAERGISDCNHRVIEADLADYEKDLLQLFGTDQVDSANVPGPVQWKFELPSATSAIAVKIAQSGTQSGETPTLKLYARSGDEPITWPSEGAVPFSAPITCAEDGSCTGKITMPFAAGPVHVQLANSGATAMVASISFTATAAPVDPEAKDDEGGCGCHVGGRTGADRSRGLLGLAVGLLGFGGWIVRRKGRSQR